jgi:DNA polymerase-3 subunit alpha
MEFFTEILSSNDGNNEKISEYINEAKEYDISFLQPSINNSNFNFEIFDNKILFGFSVVKGIGYETIKKLLSTRRSFGKKFTNWLETIAFLSKNGISVKTIELLIKIGAFDEILNDKTRSFLLKNINEIYSKSKTTLKTGEMLIKPNLIQINETEEMKKSLHEEQNLLLGFSFLEHPIIKVKNDKKINNFHKIIELRNLKENNKLKLFVLINNVREIKTKNGFLMASIKFEDETGSNNAIVFPNIYKKISDFLLQNKYFIATICKKNNELQLIDLEIN